MSGLICATFTTPSTYCYYHLPCYWTYLPPRTQRVFYGSPPASRPGSFILLPGQTPTGLHFVHYLKLPVSSVVRSSMILLLFGFRQTTCHTVPADCYTATGNFLAYQFLFWLVSLTFCLLQVGYFFYIPYYYTTNLYLPLQFPTHLPYHAWTC